jgi:hypothetical protein
MYRPTPDICAPLLLLCKIVFSVDLNAPLIIRWDRTCRTTSCADAQPDSDGRARLVRRCCRTSLELNLTIADRGLVMDCLSAPGGQAGFLNGVDRRCDETCTSKVSAPGRGCRNEIETFTPTKKSAFANLKTASSWSPSGGRACERGQPLLFQRRDHRFDMVSVVPSSLVSEMLNFSL